MLETIRTSIDNVDLTFHHFQQQITGKVDKYYTIVESR